MPPETFPQWEKVLSVESKENNKINDTPEKDQWCALKKDKSCVEKLRLCESDDLDKLYRLHINSEVNDAIEACGESDFDSDRAEKIRQMALYFIDKSLQAISDNNASMWQEKISLSSETSKESVESPLDSKISQLMNRIKEAVVAILIVVTQIAAAPLFSSPVYAANKNPTSSVVSQLDKRSIWNLQERIDPRILSKLDKQFTLSVKQLQAELKKHPEMGLQVPKDVLERYNEIYKNLMKTMNDYIPYLKRHWRPWSVERVVTSRIEILESFPVILQLTVLYLYESGVKWPKNKGIKRTVTRKWKDGELWQNARVARKSINMLTSIPLLDAIKKRDRGIERYFKLKYEEEPYNVVGSLMREYIWTEKVFTPKFQKYLKGVQDDIQKEWILFVKAGKKAEAGLGMIYMLLDKKGQEKMRKNLWSKRLDAILKKQKEKK
jgi:hypothetical protein